VSKSVGERKIIEIPKTIRGFYKVGDEIVVEIKKVDE